MTEDSDTEIGAAPAPLKQDDVELDNREEVAREKSVPRQGVSFATPVVHLIQILTSTVCVGS